MERISENIPGRLFMSQHLSSILKARKKPHLKYGQCCEEFFQTILFTAMRKCQALQEI
jgi:hypothetical protein